MASGICRLEPGDHVFTVAKTKDERVFILDFWGKDNPDLEIFPIEEATKKLYDYQQSEVLINNKVVYTKHEIFLYDNKKQAITPIPHANLKEYEEWRCRQIEAESFINMSLVKLNEDYFSFKK